MNRLNLKHIIIGLALMSISQTNVFAQGVYVDVQAGYGMPLNGQTDMLSNYSSSYIDNYITGEYSSSYTEEVVNLSLGKGMNFGANVGYMFNKNIGAEIGVNYLLGGKTEGTYSDYYTYTDPTGYTEESWEKSTQQMSAKMLQINPSFVVAGGFEKWNPYAKVGVVLGFGSIEMEADYSDNMGNNGSYAMTLNEGMAFGLSGSFGTQYILNDQISLFGEASLVSLSYSPKKGEITKYNEDGVDMLPSLTTQDKETEFVDKTSEYYDGSSTPSDPNTPSQELKTSYQFSSIGLRVGVKFNF